MSFYPDVEAAGGLAEALQAHGIEATADGRDPMHRAAVPTPVAHRNGLEISAFEHERRWSIVGGEAHQHLPLIHGYADDVAEIAGVAAAWRAGASLADICARAPFMEPTGRFEVPDGDPARLAEAEWQCVRAEMTASGLPRLHAITEAAYTAPELRQLYPYTSHWILRFSATTRPFLRDVGLSLWAETEDAFVVRSRYLGDVIGETTTAEHAVAIAVRQLPPGLGPVTSGAHEQGPPWY
ncbi:DUF6193 family natural product biosynthesis protein [Dactylosporangium sp. McL0621]|uniref:DUF6193 family natural product biosynthesis protein n=1 Tax=Dactylosporangium sp. McL0621 TaxID=3415678 RepID=UPI003CFB3466